MTSRALRPTGNEEAVEAVATVPNHPEVRIVDRFVLNPPVTGLREVAAIVRSMHVGHVNAYAAYVLIALLCVLINAAGAFLNAPSNNTDLRLVGCTDELGNTP